MNKKAQAQSLVIFFVLMIGVLITSIVVLRLTNEVITPFSQQIGNMSNDAGLAVANVQTKFTTWWDYFIILVFLVNVILLFVSAYLVDINPAFLIIYIVSMIFLFTFGNYALSALDTIWNTMGTSVEQAQTPLQQFLINNFQIIMLSVAILSGVIMYAKFKVQGQGGGTY